MPGVVCAVKPPSVDKIPPFGCCSTHVGDCRQEILCSEDGEALAQVLQRSCGCQIPGSAQGQVGWGSEQPALMEAVPAHGRGVETG